MSNLPKYLKRSPTGWYRYERRTPNALRHVFPGKRINRKLGTKDYNAALIKLADWNQYIEQLLASQRSNKLADHNWQARQAARDMLMREGLHPDQAPRLEHSATPEDFEAFKKQQRKWTEKYDFFTDIFVDTQEIGRDPHTGDPIYKAEDPTDKFQAAFNIINGHAVASVVPTFAEAVETYIEINKQEAVRKPDRQKKVENDLRKAFKTFEAYIGGPKTLLSEITRPQTRAFLDLQRQLVSESTVGRYYATPLNAMFKTACKEYGLQLASPFKGLRNTTAELETQTNWRSLTPEEFAKVSDALWSRPNNAVTLHGLLASENGCRIIDANGLEIKDIRLSSETPHIVFKSNRTRRLDKGSVKRSVPLSPALIDRLRAYSETHNQGKSPDEPFFERKYVGQNGRSNISTQLIRLIRKATDNEGDREVVEHSLRHTFKDRGRAARVDIGVIDYLQGHKSQLSSAISDRYGSGVPPEHHLADWKSIMATTKWGYFE